MASSKQKTGAQVVALGTSTTYTNEGAIANTRVPSTWYAKVRTMRKEATIALVRQLTMAPILSSAWTFEETEDAPEGAQELVKENLLPLKFELLRTSLAGCIDFGWQGYEKVFVLNNQKKAVLDKVKPLLQDFTEIRISEKTGAFDGLKQDTIILQRDATLLVSFDVEGTDWYGTSVMSAVEGAYDMWSDANEAAKRYDTKIAGAHWVVYYPPGESDYGNGVKGNSEIAKIILQALESSGRIMVPASVTEFMEGPREPGWKIEMITAAGGASFTDRLKYCDSLKVRAFGFPERSVLEGQFGTKAEAGEHGDFAITNLHLRHITLTNFYNAHLVNHILRLNYGVQAENTVKIVPAELADENKVYLKNLYGQLLTNPEGFLQEIDQIDLQAIREQLTIPSQPEEESTAVDMLQGITKPTTLIPTGVANNE